ncbi:hypothetical protein AB0E69_30730 [Kribbella sp. NPDC026611]|uniref:hypothetical protein n=1 Tax=Kribbella sp. NPDC026611 TaxID=3154911 RepID=UPI0033F0ECC4
MRPRGRSGNCFRRRATHIVMSSHDVYIRLTSAFADVVKAGGTQTAQNSPMVLSQLCDLTVGLTNRSPDDTARRWRQVLRDLPVDFRFLDAQLNPPQLGEPVANSLEQVLLWWCKQRDQLDSSHAQSHELCELLGFVGLFLLVCFGIQESEARRSVTADLPIFLQAPQAATHNCTATCGELVQNIFVQNAISRVYDPLLDPAPSPATDAYKDALEMWSRLDFSTCRFHRHGTTSVILRAQSDHKHDPELAVKLLLPPFQNIDVIAEATATYADHYSPRGSASEAIGSQEVPVVRALASTRSWITMQFLPGKTLAEFLQAHRSSTTSATEPAPRHGVSALLAKMKPNAADRTRTGVSGSVDFEELRKCGNALFHALIGFDKLAVEFQTRYHADLSPSNIMVTQIGDTYKMVFIDLGPNYLYTRSVSGTDGADSIFVAPEVKAAKSSLAKADFYSLGQLLILFGGLSPSQDGVVPDVFYADTPSIARFLEDILDRDPAKRLLNLPQTAGNPATSVYEALDEVFRIEMEIAVASQAEYGVLARRLPSRVREVLLPFQGELGRQRELMRVLRRQHRAPEQTRVLHRLYRWSWISGVVSSTTTVFVLWWLFRDANWDWGNPLVEGLNRLAQGKAVGAVQDGFPLIDRMRVSGYVVPDFSHNWLARAVGLSYALLGIKMYQSPFARISPLAAADKTPKLRFRAWAAELNMRLFAIINAALVLSVTFVDARFWPIASALGQTYALVLTVAVVKFSESALAVARTADISTVPDENSDVTGLKEFAAWIPSSLFYSLIVWIIGILIYIGKLQDVELYAATVAAVNLGLFYVIKCGLGGRDIRIALQRAVLAAERVSRQRACQKSGCASTAVHT